MKDSLEESLQLAADWMECGQGGKAMALLKKMMRQWPLEPIVFYDMGMIFYLDGKYKKAEKNFAYAVELGGVDPDLFNQWGLALERLDRRSEAFEAYQKAVQLDGEFWMAWNNLGVISFLEGEFEKARDFFTMALELNPYNADTWYNLRDTYRELGDEAGAEHADQRFEDLK